MITRQHLLILSVILLIWGASNGLLDAGVIVKMDSDTIKYSYHGHIPIYQENYPGTRQNECVPSQELKESGIKYVSISTAHEYKGFVFPEEYLISSDGDNYKFITPYDDVERGFSPSSACGLPFYKTQVYKNGDLIDSITYERGLDCNQYNMIGVVKTYGNLQVTFADHWDYEGQCAGKRTYVIHKYELLDGSTESTTEETTEETTEDSTEETPTTNNPGSTVSDVANDITETTKGFFESIGDFFSNLINSILGVFR